MSRTPEGTAHYELEDRVAWITLDRPPLNVLDIAMMRRCSNALADAEERGAVAVVWKGAGDRAFSAGVEIRQHTPDLVDRMLEHFHELFRRMDRMDAVQIASVRGHCLGGGMELACFCDLVLATESSAFSQPEIDVGCFPPVAAALLPSRIGPQRAAEAVLLGRKYSAAEMEAMGLVNRLVPDDGIEEATRELVQELLEKSPAVLALARKALRAGRPVDFGASLERVEKIYLDELCETEDIQEGIDAFLQRRRPVWKGA